MKAVMTHQSSIRAYLSSTLALDLSTTPPALANSLRRRLTLTKAAFIGEDSLEEYFLENNGWLHIPRGFYLSAAGQQCLGRYQLELTDARSRGYEFAADVNVKFGVPPFPKGQPSFINDIVQNSIRNSHGGQAIAPTRSGKTLCSLKAACLLGYHTLILVDRSVLLQQWKDAIENYVLVNGKPARCGVLREDSFEFGPEYPFTVGMIQTLHRRQLSDAFRKSFGCVLTDECQSAPCDMIWGVIQRIESQYVIGLSGTPDRKDGLEDAISWVIGPHIAYLSRKLEADVHFVSVPSKFRDRNFRGRTGVLDVLKSEKRMMSDEHFVQEVLRQVDAAIKADRRVLLLMKLCNSVELIAAGLRGMGYDPGIVMGGYDVKANMVKNPVVGTYSMCGTGTDFLPPPTVLGLVGPVSDPRQAMGRGLQPQAEVRPIILDFVYCAEPLIRQAYKRLRLYMDRSERDFTICNQF